MGDSRWKTVDGPPRPCVVMLTKGGYQVSVEEGIRRLFRGHGSGYLQEVVMRLIVQIGLGPGALADVLGLPEKPLPREASTALHLLDRCAVVESCSRAEPVDAERPYVAERSNVNVPPFVHVVLRPATRAVEAIIADLDRRGLKWEWEKIDEDVKAEIVATWTSIVERMYDPATNTSSGDNREGV